MDGDYQYFISVKRQNTKDFDKYTVKSTYDSELRRARAQFLLYDLVDQARLLIVDQDEKIVYKKFQTLNLKRYYIEDTLTVIFDIPLEFQPNFIQNDCTKPDTIAENKTTIILDKEI